MKKPTWDPPKGYRWKYLKEDGQWMAHPIKATSLKIDKKKGKKGALTINQAKNIG